MRHNGFGDAYCHTVQELRTTIDEHPNGWECYLASVDPPVGDDKACGEVCENASGDLVCYIEADTEEAVRAIAKEANLEGA